MARDADISKFMSFALRHAPDEAGLVLDEAGWTDLDALCAALEARFGASREDALRIVEESPKRRFALLNGRIRAAQGHSVSVDRQFAPTVPPERLLHDGKIANHPAILVHGLLKGDRRHVHLSADLETAENIASRRKGESVIYDVASQEMHADGGVFVLPVNGVRLTDAVPPRYLSSISETFRS